MVGGDAQDSDWTFTISGGNGTAKDGDVKSYETGVYILTEAGPSDYHFESASGVCALNGNQEIELTAITEGGTCTITNTRDQGTIELKKEWSGTGGQTTLNIGTSVDGTQVASVQTGASGGNPLTTGTMTVDTGTYYVSEIGGLTDYNSSLACTDNETPVSYGANNSLLVATGHVVICTFTNIYNPPVIKLLLSKTSAEIAGKTASPGDTITYTLTVTNNSDFTAFGVVVQDSLPDGFSYVLGTTTGTGWTASEPSISGNKLTWAVGDIAGGGEVIINYDAQISSSLKDGSYPNIAVASGSNRKAGGDIVYSWDEFYTAVGIGISYSAAVGGGVVLGAATGQVLGAATGSPTYLLIIAILMILVGLVIYFRKGRKFHV